MATATTLRRRREFVWSEWAKIQRNSSKPIPLKQRSKIFKRLNSDAKRRFK